MPDAPHPTNVRLIEDESLDTTLAATSGLVLVDFWAEWCGPCRFLAPIIDQVASAHPELTVLKVEVDHNPRTAAKYAVFSIPTVQFFRGGIAVGEPIVGVQKPAAYEAAIAAYSPPAAGTPSEDPPAAA